MGMFPQVSGEDGAAPVDSTALEAHGTAVPLSGMSRHLAYPFNMSRGTADSLGKRRLKAGSMSHEVGVPQVRTPAL